MFGRINQEHYVSTGLRLPPQLHADLVEAAERSGRSLNAEMLSRLGSTFSNPKPMSASEKHLALLELTSSVLAFVALRFHDRIPERVKADPEVRLALAIVEVLDGASRPSELGKAGRHQRSELTHATFEQFQVRPRPLRGGWFSDALNELRELLLRD